MRLLYTTLVAAAGLLGFASAAPAPAQLDANEASLVVRSPLDTPESEAREQNANSDVCTLFQIQEQHPTTHQLIWVDDPSTRNVATDQCHKYCQPQLDAALKADPNAYTNCGCIGFNVKYEAYGPGKQVGAGHCSCNNQLINAIAKTFIEALPIIAQIGCNILMSALNLVIDIGSVFVGPAGPEIAAAINGGIQAAKLASYTYDAASLAATAFSNWASPCGTDKLPPGMAKAFDIMNMVTPLVLPKGSFFNGKTPGWTKGSGRDGDAGTPKKPDKPSPTKKPDETTKKPEETAPACSRSGNNKRAPKKDCNDDVKHVTRWTLQKSKADDKLTTITSKCVGTQYPDACAHYASAITKAEARGGKNKGFTCEDENKRDDATATKDYYDQHKVKNGKDWAEFTASEYNFVGKNHENKMKEPACQADEWPPAYFLPSKKADREKKTWGQLIRWLPGAENGGAANAVWAGFCADNDGGKGNAQRVGQKKGEPAENFPLNEKLVKTQGKPKERVETAADKKTVTHHLTYDNAVFTRAVFEIDFDWTGMLKPSDDNDWRLKDNPCWPKALAEDDPGFCLLTDDPWYKRTGTDKDEKLRKTYKDSPPDNLVQRARADPGSKRPHDTTPSKKRFVNIEGTIMVRDDTYNETRPASNEELRREVQVIDCKDRICSKERRELGDEDDGSLFIPGDLPDMQPPQAEAQPTILPRGGPTTLRRVDRRRSPSDNMPIPTIMPIS